ncbi:unnamed protein product [Adineta steineri]|uniref:Saposin B-type domain-containing protein n=1 Tax=Adineta steineri TaxID=433720 RepID=A0A813QLD4_9BILA|nr:unnamed protein product [Adineta steineri]CAF0768538.1 unnamed protein product [Adineta steineri]
MYKALTCVLIALVGITSASNVFNVKSYNIQQVASPFAQPELRLTLCPACIDIADRSINVLLELILDTGIIGSCSALCQALGQKTGSAILATVCDLVCDVVGIDEFIKMIDKADIDPIWYCEIAKMCPINDHGDAKFTKFTIAPASGPKGTTFTFDFAYTSVNGTGTGELDIDIQCPDKIPIGTGFLLEASKAGTYGQKVTVKAEPDPHCDPTQEMCEEWLPGTYNVTIQVCNGECGSKHPHSAIYDTVKGSFVLTK